jgi:hypothetical protein
VQGLPYIIVHEIDERNDEIIVLGIFHGAQQRSQHHFAHGAASSATGRSMERRRIGRQGRLPIFLEVATLARWL